eukprot:scaffold516_cov401-Prasinococcus_capsulatus_cf.AAC.16
MVPQPVTGRSVQSPPHRLPMELPLASFWKVRPVSPSSSRLLDSSAWPWDSRKGAQECVPAWCFVSECDVRLESWGLVVVSGLLKSGSCGWVRITKPQMPNASRILVLIRIPILFASDRLLSTVSSIGRWSDAASS